jgi:hypothetical protein
MALSVQATVANNATTGTTLTTALNVGTATNRVLVVAAFSASAQSGVTYNAVAMTESVRVDPNNVCANRIWELEDPDTGSNNIILTQASSTNIGYSGIAFNDAGTVTTVNDTTGTGVTNPSISITTAADGSFLVDNIDHTAAITVGDGQTQVQNIDSGAGWNHGVSYKSAGAAGAKTMSWTANSGTVDYSVVEVTEDIAPIPANAQFLQFFGPQPQV